MNAGKVVFEIDAETKSFDAQIEDVKKQLNTLMTNYETTKNMKPFEGQEEDLKELGLEIEKLNNKLVGLQNQQKKVQEENSKTGISFEKSFKNGIKTMSKLALGIIGVRSAYNLARRAASAAMSENTEIAEKMQKAWVGLGSFLVPFLDWFSNAMLKIVGYINEFIKALTDRDFIAEQNARAIEKQAKAQANLNKEMQKYQQYDFDVIRTQQDQTSSSISSSSDTSGLIEIPELNEEIVKKLQKLAKWLRENKELIEAVGIALGITFGAIAIGNLLSSIGALIGSGVLLTGLAGLAAILSVLAIAWSIKIIIDGIEELNEANKIARDLLDNLDKLSSKGAKQATDPNAPTEVPEYYQNVAGNIEDAMFELEQGVKDLKRIAGKNALLFQLGVIGKEETYRVEKYRKELKKTVATTIELAKMGKLNETGYQNLAKFAEKYGDKIEELNNLENEYYINQKELNEIVGNYSKYVKTASTETNSYGKNINNLTTEYEHLLIAFKKEHPEIKLDTEEGKKQFEEFITMLGYLPPEKTTNIDVDTKTANEKLWGFKNDLFNWIPDKKTMTVEVKGEASQMASILDTVGTAMDLLMPGTAIGWSLRNQANMLKNLKYFATGGYVSQPTLAVVGEGHSKGEYMIPDGEDYISRLANEIGQYGNGGVTNVYLDGRLIQRQMSKTTDRINFTRNGR